MIGSSGADSACGPSPSPPRIDRENDDEHTESNLATALAAPPPWRSTGIGAAAAQSVVVYNRRSTKLMQAFVDDFQKANPGIRSM